MAETIKRSGSKRGATPKTEKRRAVVGFVWLAVGLLVGLFIAFLVFLQNRDSAKKISPRDSGTTSAQPKDSTSTKKEEQPFSFDFYKRLPQMEVNVPKSDSQPKTPTTPTKPATDQKPPVNSTAKTGTFILQVGSFKRFEDADRHKANLAMLGIVSKIVPINVDNKETWHRVQIGPISDEKELNDVRQTLSERHIEAILIKVRG